jgi:hypothetical protein
MNVHFLILNINESTKAIDSLSAAGYEKKDFTIINVKNSIPITLNKTISKLKPKSEYYYCIIPDNATIVKNFKDIVAQYNSTSPEESPIYLPLIELFVKENDKEQLKGILNKCVWYPYFATIIGEMDHDLALKQIDTHFYGALIPAHKIKDISFREDIKYYWYFECFNRITSKNEIIKGLPKILFTLTEDYQLSTVSQEEKKADFDLAKEEYV